MDWTTLRQRRMKPEAVLRRLGYYEPPIPIISVARDLGITVRSIDSETWSGAAEFDVESGRALIVYNRRDPKHRQRFTVAHEIAHCVLHRDGIKYRDRSFLGIEDEEAQANGYAAALLMPADLVDEALGPCKYRVDRLAERFDVSREAMSIRLKKLYGWT